MRDYQRVFAKLHVLEGTVQQMEPGPLRENLQAIVSDLRMAQEALQKSESSGMSSDAIVQRILLLTEWTLLFEKCLEHLMK